jgi:hypothetical protein
VVHYVAFHPNQNLLVSHAWDGTTRVWSLDDGSQLLAAEGYFVRFDPEGRLLAFRNGLQLGLWEVASSGECRMLHGSGTLPDDIHTVAISPNDRLMASGGKNGLRLWDLATLEELAQLPTGTMPSMRFHPRDGSLITNSPLGLYKWPITRQPTSRQLAIGPPVILALGRPTGIGKMDMTSDARTIVVDGFNRSHAAVIQPALDKTTILRSGSHRMYIAVSPDGKWVARGNYKASGVEVWDGQTGKLLHTLPISGTATVAFSPDGQWLVTAATEYQFWRTGSWQPERVIRGLGSDIGGRMAFSPDGELLAITISHNLVRLMANRTGRVLADLEATPKPAWVQGICFNSDGSQLATTCGTDGIRVWDLRRIRDRLATMGLDWDQPPFPEAELESSAPLDVEVDLGSAPAWPHLATARWHYGSQRWQDVVRETSQAIELAPDDPEGYLWRARAKLRLGEYESALPDLEKSGGPHANDAVANNSVAWSLVVQPEAGRRYAQLAIAWSQRAVELAPEKGTYWNTLGVAHYRGGDWDEALVALAKSDEILQGEKLSLNTFFLAMAHWQKGNREEARAWYGKSTAWMDEHMPQNAELQGFRKEATQLMGKPDSVTTEATENEG